MQPESGDLIESGAVSGRGTTEDDMSGRVERGDPPSPPSNNTDNNNSDNDNDNENTDNGDNGDNGDNTDNTDNTDDTDKTELDGDSEEPAPAPAPEAGPPAPARQTSPPLITFGIIVPNAVSPVRYAYPSGLDAMGGLLEACLAMSSQTLEGAHPGSVSVVGSDGRRMVAVYGPREDGGDGVLVALAPEDEAGPAVPLLSGYLFKIHGMINFAFGSLASGIESLDGDGGGSALGAVFERAVESHFGSGSRPSGPLALALARTAPAVLAYRTSVALDTVLSQSLTALEVASAALHTGPFLISASLYAGPFLLHSHMGPDLLSPTDSLLRILDVLQDDARAVPSNPGPGSAFRQHLPGLPGTLLGVTRYGLTLAALLIWPAPLGSDPPNLAQAEDQIVAEAQDALEALASPGSAARGVSPSLSVAQELFADLAGSGPTRGPDVLDHALYEKKPGKYERFRKTPASDAAGASSSSDPTAAASSGAGRDGDGPEGIPERFMYQALVCSDLTGMVVAPLGGAGGVGSLHAAQVDRSIHDAFVVLQSTLALQPEVEELKIRVVLDSPAQDDLLPPLVSQFWVAARRIRSSTVFLAFPDGCPGTVVEHALHFLYAAPI